MNYQFFTITIPPLRLPSEKYEIRPEKNLLKLVKNEIRRLKLGWSRMFWNISRQKHGFLLTYVQWSHVKWLVDAPLPHHFGPIIYFCVTKRRDESMVKRLELEINFFELFCTKCITLYLLDFNDTPKRMSYTTRTSRVRYSTEWTDYSAYGTRSHYQFRVQ